MQSWQTDLLIKRQIFTPSKRLIVCEEGINQVLNKHLRYEAFLKKFRSRSKDSSGAAKDAFSMRASLASSISHNRAEDNLSR